MGDYEDDAEEAEDEEGRGGRVGAHMISSPRCHLTSLVICHTLQKPQAFNHRQTGVPEHEALPL
eukprot:4836693-Alexandrium_andersonii.AAC.1